MNPPDRSEGSPTEAQREKLLGLQIIHGAMMLGVLVFAGVVAFLGLRRGAAGEAEPDTGLLAMLTLGHVFAALGAIFVSSVVPGTHRRSNVRKAARDHDAESVVDAAAASSFMEEGIVRVAPLEGTAIFGVVICLLAVFEGVSFPRSVYFLNAVSPMVFLLYGLVSFPTRGKMQEHAREFVRGVEDERALQTPIREVQA